MGSRSRSAVASVLVVDRLVVIVNMGLFVVVLVLLAGIVVVAMKERGMVVLMAVIVGAVLELAERTAGVVVRHVVMIVTMHLCGVQMLLLIRLAANGCLSAGACSLVRHRWLPSQYVVIVPPCRTDADIRAPKQALRSPLKCSLVERPHGKPLDELGYSHVVGVSEFPRAVCGTSSCPAYHRSCEPMGRRGGGV